MLHMIYISGTRIPSERAHSYQIMKMCEVFTQNDVQVKLLHPFRFNTPAMKQVQDIWSYYGVEDRFKMVKLFALDLPALKRLSQRLWFFVRALSYSFSVIVYLLFQKLKRGPFTVYSRDKISVLMISRLKWILRVKIFYEIHDFPESRTRTVIDRYRRLDGLIVITEHLKRLYTEAGIETEKILVAPDGVDLKRFGSGGNKSKVRHELGLPVEQKIIGYTGHLFPWKGVYTLADSAQYLQDSMIMIVGGTPEDFKRFEAVVKGKGHNNILLIGHVPPHSVPLYLVACDVLVLPNSAKYRISQYYTSPLKLFEYMAAKRPIVASDLPSIREILTDGKNAILVAPDDPRALADGIKRLLDDDCLAECVSDRALEKVQKYTWQRRAEFILRYIRDVGPGSLAGPQIS